VISSSFTRYPSAPETFFDNGYDGLRKASFLGDLVFGSRLRVRALKTQCSQSLGRLCHLVQKSR
jgi:hypothetical protein